MKIVVLDGFTSNPGDLDWDGLDRLGDLTVYERTAPPDVVPRAAGAGAIITNKTVISAEVMAALPELRYIGLLSTGMNVVDLPEAARRGIAVTNVPAYGTMSVAQTVFALLLDLTNRTELHSRAVHDGAWTESRDFCFMLTPLIELDGLTFGVMGLGEIGRAVAGIAAAFGMKVIAHSRTPKHLAGVREVGIPELFRESDVLSLHCPLTPETAEIVNRETLAWMKPGAFLINTGRGGLVNEAALAGALREKRLAGAGLDVLSCEPPAADNPLLSAPNCVITPHIAWASYAARKRLIATVEKNLKAFLAGHPGL